MKRRDLDERDALALALVLFRDRVGTEALAADIADVYGFDRTTAWRALRRLRSVGLLDDSGAPTGPAMQMAEGSFLRVRTSDVRVHGKAEAIVLAQLPSMPTMRIVRTRDGYTELPSRLLSGLIGCCMETAATVLDRLSTGLTTRVKQAQRRGEAVVVKPVIKLLRSIGRAFRVRMLTEREQQPRPATPPTAAKGAATKPKPEREAAPGMYVPSMEELKAYMSAAQSRGRRP